MQQLTTTDVLRWLNIIERLHGPVPLWVVSERAVRGDTVPCMADMPPCVDVRLQAIAGVLAVLVVGAGVIPGNVTSEDHDENPYCPETDPGSCAHCAAVLAVGQSLHPMGAAEDDWNGYELTQPEPDGESTAALLAGHAVEIEAEPAAPTTPPVALQCSICGCADGVAGCGCRHDCWWVRFDPPVCSRCG